MIEVMRRPPQACLSPQTAVTIYRPLSDQVVQGPQTESASKQVDVSMDRTSEDAGEEVETSSDKLEDINIDRASGEETASSKPADLEFDLEPTMAGKSVEMVKLADKSNKVQSDASLHFHQGE